MWRIRQKTGKYKRSCLCLGLTLRQYLNRENEPKSEAVGLLSIVAYSDDSNLSLDDEQSEDKEMKE